MTDFADRLAALPPEKRALLARRMLEKGIDLSKDYILPVPRTQPGFPLSFSQQRLWFFDKLVPGSPVYNLPVALRITGDLRGDLLERSVSEIVRRHEALRHTFIDLDGQPVQRVTSPQHMRIPLVDLTALPVERREALVPKLAEDSARRSFDLSTGPLIAFGLVRVAADEHILLLVVHHIVSDGWSAGIFIRELAEIYSAFAENRPAPLADLPIQFIDYVAWQQQRMAGATLEAELAFWKATLAGAPAVLELPTDRPRPPVQTFRGSTTSRRLPPEMSAALHRLCKQEGATLFMVLLAAFQALLSRYTGQHDLLIGSPIAGRSRREVEGLIGFFVNTVVLRTSLDGNPSVSELLARTRTTALNTFAHQDVPFEQIVEIIQPERSLSHTPIFQVAFVLQNAPTQVLKLPGVTIEPLAINSGVAKFDLHLDASETPDGLHLLMEYSTDLFDRATIDRMLSQYERMLAGFVDNPSQPVAQIDLLSQAERTLLKTWNATVRPYPALSVPALVAHHAARRPDAIALRSGETTVTYGALVAHANQLAHRLQADGVGRGTCVGVYLERGAELVTTLLGVLSAGAAYVPLDVSYPQERIALMLADAEVTQVITSSALADRLPPTVQGLCLDTTDLTAEPTTPPAVTLDPDDLAYVIYTSGSTGRPKGVAVPHRAIVRLVHNTNYIDLSATDVVAQASNVSFDAATFELWGPLTHGARLVIVPQSVMLSPQDLRDLLGQEQITTLFLTTALFNQIARVAPMAFGGLRYLLFGGEAVDPGSVRQVLQQGPPMRLLHMYGPTENTTYSTWHHVIDVAANASTVPIGGPLANDVAYVLDGYGAPVPVGVPGELYVGGDGLAWGYLQRPDLTAERFVPNTFGDQPGARLYRTGDLVRWDADGQIEYLGRIDQQVKLRGFRIELGEIEALLRKHPAVEEAVVILREDRPGDKRLVAYVVEEPRTQNLEPNGEQENKGTKEQAVMEIPPRLSQRERGLGGEGLPPSLRAFLQERLPSYMIPAAIVPLATLPINQNGKIDRRALPMPDLLGAEAGPAYEAPQTPTEELLAEIWAQSLGVERVGRNDNFFALGGDSIMAIKVATLATQAGLNISTKDVFQQQTIAELALLAESTAHGEQPGTVPQTPKALRLASLDQTIAQGFYRAVIFDSPGSLDPAMLQAALNAVVSHHESLRLRILRDGGVPMLELSDQHEAPALTVIELAGAATDERKLADAIAELGASLDLARGPLLTAALIRRAAGPDGLLMIVHELAADPHSWSILLEDLSLAYAQARQSRPILLPPSSANLTTWARALHAHMLSTPIVEDIERWKAQATEQSDAAREARKQTGAPSQSLITPIDQLATGAVLQQLPSTYHAQPEELLTMVLAWAVGQWRSTSTVILALESDSRADLIDVVGSRVLGGLSTLYPAQLDLPAGSLTGAIPALKEQLRACARRGLSFDLGSTLADAPTRDALAAVPNAEIRFRYDALPAESAWFTAVGDVTPSLTSDSPYAIDVRAAVRQGRLELRWEFNATCYTPASIEQLARGCVEALQQLIEQQNSVTGKSYVPSDFPMAQLDKAKLNKLLNNLSGPRRKN